MNLSLMGGGRCGLRSGVTLVSLTRKVSHTSRSALGLPLCWLGWPCVCLVFRFLAVTQCHFLWLQGRSVKDSTLRRAQRRSFTPASFLEEDTVDFPDELDTSFFARVRSRALVCCWPQRQHKALGLAGLCVAESNISIVMLVSSDGTSVSLPRKESFTRSSLLTQMKCLSHRLKLQSKTLR